MLEAFCTKKAAADYDPLQPLDIVYKG